MDVSNLMLLLKNKNAAKRKLKRAASKHVVLDEAWRRFGIMYPTTQRSDELCGFDGTRTWRERHRRLGCENLEVPLALLGSMVIGSMAYFTYL